MNISKTLARNVLKKYPRRSYIKVKKSKQKKKGYKTVTILFRDS